MGIVVELGSMETAGQEGNRMNLTILKVNREDGGNSVVGSVGFHDKLTVGNPMGKDRSMSESLFQLIECSQAFIVEIPQNALASETC